MPLAVRKGTRLGVAVDDRHQRNVAEQHADADQYIRQTQTHHDAKIGREARKSKMADNYHL